jgi:Rod binding domain-containing protein
MADLVTASPLPEAGIPARPHTADPAKIRDAAQQFEGLLLAELLKSAHPDGGWLGGGDDGASGTAFSFAEQQLAATMAKQGGIGLAHLVVQGLEKQS